MRFLTAAFFTCLFVAPAAFADVWFVNAAASGSANGTSWTDAFTDMQSAVNAASGDGGGEVWVATGTYTSTAGAVVSLAAGVHVYGGFLGTESQLGERAWKANVTIIHGEGARRCVVGASNTTLDGFTVTQGSLLGHGGGMLNDGVSPTVENCLFHQNAVTGSGLAGGRGAGMYNANGAAPIVRNCIFTENMTPGGGAAIYNHLASPSITNCIFHDNNGDTDSVGYSGGAVFNSESPASLINCLFYRNTAYTGGAVANYKSGAVFTNCTFTRNTATYSDGPAGGGAFNSAVLPSDPKPAYTNCILWGNFQGEGEIADISTTSTVTYCDVRFGWPGAGNLNSNPRFVDLANDNYRLGATSALIDAGANSAVTVSTDLDGKQRQFNVVDMGPYEYFVIQVTAVSPMANALNVPLSTSMTAQLDIDLGSLSGSGKVFLLRSAMTPFLNGTNVALAYDGTNPFILSLDPVRNLQPGERVFANVYADDFPVRPFSWEFRTAVSPSSEGVFTDSGQSLAAQGGHGGALADFDGDGDLDAFVVNRDGANTVWMNNGSGLLTDSGQTLGGANSRDTAVGDLDGDGDLDAIVAGDYADRLWLNNGDGTFSYGQEFGNADDLTVALADVDGDGDLDALMGAALGPCMLYLNLGGAFSSSAQENGGWSSTNDIAIGDLDGDGSPDIFRANFMMGCEVLLNGRDGSFDGTGQEIEGSDTYAADLGDLDGDLDLDVFLVRQGGCEVWFNNGTGFLTNSGQLLGTAQGADVSLGDVDGDGDLDAFVANGAGGTNAIWLNNGSGGFSNSGMALAAEDNSGAALGDLNGDGALDAFTTNLGGPNHVWFNTSQALVATNPATGVQVATATINGYVLTSGSPAVNERGFYWSTSPIDTSNLTGTTKVTVAPDPGGAGSFSWVLNGLSAGTPYYFVAYGYNGVTTVFGTKRTFTTKMTPAIGWADPAALTYGDTLDAAQLNATANVPGEFVYTPAAGTLLDAGTHTLRVDFTPEDDVLYAGAMATVDVTVNQAVAAVTLEGLSQTYDGQPKPATATTTPPGLNVLITYDGQAAPPLNVGEYAVVATIQDVNYAGQASGILTIRSGLPAVSTGGLCLLFVLTGLVGVRTTGLRKK